MLGLKNPVPTTLKAMPKKKKALGSIANKMLPIIIKIPPQNKERRFPKILSANKPPTKVKAYTNACVAPYCRLATTSLKLS